MSAEGVEVESVQIGAFTLARPAFAVLDMRGLPISTIIGCEVPRRLVVRADYDARLLTLTRQVRLSRQRRHPTPLPARTDPRR